MPVAHNTNVLSKLHCTVGSCIFVTIDWVDEYFVYKNINMIDCNNSTTNMYWVENAVVLLGTDNLAKKWRWKCVRV